MTGMRISKMILHIFIIFHNQVFKIDRNNQEQYDEAKEYGLSLGIPDYQVDFKVK